jgi:hypothetical protein
MPANAGAVSITRDAEVPQPGHCCGSLRARIGRIAVKLPHCAQSYS